MAEEPDDNVLMIRYQEGDLAAFDMLYTRHKGPLYRYFLRQGLHRDSVAEVFQEVWIKIIRAKDRYRSTAKFTTYMYQLAHNCLIDHVRVQNRTPRAQIVSAAIDPSELAGHSTDNPGRRAEQTELLERFGRALAELPVEQREAFVLREESGLSLADIASVTGVAPETAKSRLRYAVKKLRTVLGDTENSL